jgi:hypothetical protein
MNHQEYFDHIVQFIERVGIRVARAEVSADSFLPGIAIADGALVVDVNRLQWPGDLLHEAGHLAVLPSELRARASDDVQVGAELGDAGEQEALAWAYAAAVELAIPIEVLIHEGGYRGGSKALLQMYEVGIYPGLRGLCSAGLTQAVGFTENCGEIRYPRMLRWLRN